MNRSTTKILLLATIVSAGSLFTSCKSKENTDATKDTASIVAPAPVAPTPPPVVIAEDTTLNVGIKDATKDFPGVTATTIDGEITLTGEITREKLPVLMQSLSTLHAKKINNKLTIK